MKSLKFRSGSKGTMVAATIDVFSMTYEQSVAYFNPFENLEKIKRTNGISPPSVNI
jgi:hypothetical protein